MTDIAIIPARGGSKRIPRKNITGFRGRPMIGWTIEAALASDLFDLVLVSTDDTEIAEIARSEGAEAPFLRTGHADDQTPVSIAVLTALEQAESHYGQSFGTVTQLMPNCPLRGDAEIRDAWTHFKSGTHPFQISASAFGAMTPWWAARLMPDGRPDWLHPDARLRRSQDLDPLYCPTGAIWMASASALRMHRTFYGPGHVLCPISWTAAIDIDDRDDLYLAEALAALKGTHDNGSSGQCA
ncbi:acylneuraminate cytidylyltransferase family protein [Roseovarius sp. TE539]|uniref:acylneuraminate cytidylyltransferase family protein n=1 Tax=Roseovarius sp. TE539 TaxID=2249812 RepID=UPI000DDDE14D|nr:acylneuraminate cytidylyltransferase family protein [Roseovarius sp. TE539]RBI72250.1 acylneuraminate cytidylyltransferase family protein [Roseovarius sp. TE539]